MTRTDELHKKWSKDPAYRDAYEALEDQFRLAETLIGARIRAGLSQTELAEKMKTSQSHIARLESGKVHRSTKSLERFARATGMRLRISFEPLR
jgi:ribosome-binding protein aMBF1 (putative translation factor)